MLRFYTAGLIYLILALGLEFGVLPLLGEPSGWLIWGQSRLVALGVIMAGCLRGQSEALPFALIAALLAGSAAGAGHLGATLLSFVLVAYLAGGARSWFYFDLFWVRTLVIAGLVLGESWVCSAVRHLFWPAVSIQLQWPIHLIMALIASLLYIPLKRWLGRARSISEPIGRQTR